MFSSFLAINLRYVSGEKIWFHFGDERKSVEGKRRKRDV
jgi:hypothetical protein